MKSFEDLYNEELKLLIDTYEKRRQNFLFMIFIYLSIAPLVYFVISKYIQTFEILVYGLYALFLTTGFIFYVARSRRDFQIQLMGKLVKFIDPSLEYYPNQLLPIDTYNKSLLFPEEVDKYSGHDLVSGKVGLTRIAFSHVHSQRKERRTYIDEKGRLKTEVVWVTVFKGILFMADFNKSFKSKVLVVPNSERLDINLKHMKMEDPEFERFFDVYGEDQIETRYILSTSLMERITRLKQKLKEQGAGSIRLSFVDSQLFIAIELGRSFLNIPIFRRFSYVHLLDYYEDLKTLYDVVEELNLNTRIWSKS